MRMRAFVSSSRVPTPPCRLCRASGAFQHRELGVLEPRDVCEEEEALLAPVFQRRSSATLRSWVAKPSPAISLEKAFKAVVWGSKYSVMSRVRVVMPLSLQPCEGRRSS